MSDSHLIPVGHIVVGTAGHIDHGKTSLVKALTGIDADRLAEEKRRGISIDLGFAHFTLPSGGEISFVDVPGHERFIKNMLAGVGGTEAVLLVVAANESVKPQTREHFEICRLLGVERGIIALTKCDIASEEQLAKTRIEIDRLRMGSFLANAAVIPVSVVTGDGLAEVVRALEKLFQTANRCESEGLARLPVDRSFALKGFGTIVTGTVWSGKLRVGDIVQLQPSTREARIRGLQVHGKAVPEVTAGQRTAVNLSGIEHTSISRGDVLSVPGLLQSTRCIQASVEWLAEAELPGPRENCLLHLGTSEIPARVSIFPGPDCFVQLHLKEPLLALPGDRFVFRRPSPSQTIGGGVVIDPFPRKWLKRLNAVARLRCLRASDLTRRLELLVEEKINGRTLEDLIRSTGYSAQAVKESLAQSSSLLSVDSGRCVILKSWLTRRREQLLRWLRDFHLQHPSLAGAPIVQARLGLEPALANVVFAGFPAIKITGDLISLVDYKPQMSSQESAALARLEQAFREAGYQPSNAMELVKAAGVRSKDDRALLEQLIKAGRLVRVSESLVFHADVVAHIRNSLSRHKGRRFSIPEFKEWTKISRKHAIPLLEYLDHQRVTKRDGDARVVL